MHILTIELDALKRPTGEPKEAIAALILPPVFGRRHWAYIVRQDPAPDAESRVPEFFLEFTKTGHDECFGHIEVRRWSSYMAAQADAVSQFAPL